MLKAIKLRCYQFDNIYGHKEFDNNDHENLFVDTTKVTINKIPQDIWKEIFYYLSPNTLSNTKLVCKQWNNIINGNKILAEESRKKRIKIAFFGPDGVGNIVLLSQFRSRKLDSVFSINDEKKRKIIDRFKFYVIHDYQEYVKTPLDYGVDVAIFCSDIFATRKNRSYFIKYNNSKYIRENTIKILVRTKIHLDHLPLLLRGARQVGKSYLIERFGQAHFDSLVTVNFEFQPEFKSCFNSLDPAEITNTISLLAKKPIIPGKTLLFLDEIQDCPNAIKALRYFKELMPKLHVIGAGSLLEFSLNDDDFRMPVGRVLFMYLKPLSFKEYLTATDNSQLRNYLEQITLKAQISEGVHQRLLKLMRDYTVLGGMPAVIQEYLKSNSFQQCQLMQSALLNAYRADFGKYAAKTDHKYLQQLFERIPGLIAQHFKYAKVDPDSRARDLKIALQKLRDAGLIYQVLATAVGLPLSTISDEKRFKLLFLDAGLVNRASKLDADILLQEDLLLINRGMIAEQFVGQELLAYGHFYEPGQLFFWNREQRGSTAEVDFVINIDSTIVPIEVKSGTTGRLKSLHMFMAEKKSKVGIQISQQPFNHEQSILRIPLYMIGEISRLVLSLI